MTIDRLHFICRLARQTYRDNPAQICVTLNRGTYMALYDTLRKQGYVYPLPPHGINVFTFCGCLVSWSPMYDEQPLAYHAGVREVAH